MKTAIQIFDDIINSVSTLDEKPTLLLHACCAPCASAVLETLTPYFDVTVYFYNPNISPIDEYQMRLYEMKRYLDAVHPDVDIIAPVWDGNEFLSVVRGLEGEREGGSRCKVCFDLRLTCTSNLAKELGYDYFATTLTVSPLKNATLINAIGESLSIDGCKYLTSDFKKRDGYKKSIELSKTHDLYRQDYCGCVFSKLKDKEQ